MKKVFKVGSQYRTNPLSQTSGGVTVYVIMKDGKNLSYDNIKNPNAYIHKLMQNPEVDRAFVQ